MNLGATVTALTDGGFTSIDVARQSESIATQRQGHPFRAALLALVVGLAAACAPADSPTAVTPADLAPSFSIHAGSLVLSSQAAVNAASGITEVTGNVLIGNPGGSDITDLTPLSALTSIGGYLSLYHNPVLTSGDGLTSLTSVGGYVEVQFNWALTNVDGLSSLTSVGGDLEVYVNDALTNVDGLSSLTSVGGDLYFYNNDALTNVDGLSSLSSVGGAVRFHNNAALANVDALSSLTSVPEDLLLSGNDALGNVDGLSNLTSVGGYLAVVYSSALTNLDGLSSLASIGGWLDVAYNAALTNVDGLSSLTSVGGYLYMVNNPAITNVDGLSSLASVGEYLSVYGNETLGNCTGLYPLLTDGTIGGAIAIGPNNAPGCNSVVELLAGVSPDEAIRYLATGVGDLEDSGALSEGQAGSLVTKLDKAIGKLEAGQVKVATNLLNAFIGEVTDLVATGELEAVEGQPLIDQALVILAAIEASG